MTTLAIEREPLTWVSINLEFGGVDFTPGAPLLRRCGSVSLERLNRLGELVTFAEYKPDVIFLQEGRTYDANGDELLHYSERVLRKDKVGIYRGFLSRSAHNDLHQVVYINNDRLQVVRHWHGGDPNEGARRLGWVEVIVDDDESRSIMLKSDHWDPTDGDRRLANAKFSAGAVRGHQRAIRAGDYNSTTSRRSEEQGEPQRDFLAQAPSDRFGEGTWPSTKPDGDTDADTRALDYLIDVGWTDQHIADHSSTPTTHAQIDRGGELIIDRCLTHGALRTVQDPCASTPAMAVSPTTAPWPAP